MFDSFFTTLLYWLVRCHDLTFWWTPLVTGAAFILALSALKTDDEGAAGAWALLALPGLAAVALHFGIPPLANWYRPANFTWPFWHVPIMAVGFVAGVALGMWWLRVGQQKMNVLSHRVTRRNELERNRKTDIREIGKFLPGDQKFFDPRKFFSPKKGLFLGLDEHQKPVYIQSSTWDVSHVLLTGRTRSGKGVAAQSLLYQAIQRGEFVVILDPKSDNWLPHIYFAAAKQAKQPYVFLNVNPSAPPQFNIFAGCDAETLENMLIGGFSLSEKGEAADFYRLADRKAARQLASWIAEQDNTPTPRDCVVNFGDRWENDAPAFGSYMAELAEVPAINRADGGGLDLLKMVQTGGCLYTVGDMINPRILRIQRMLLVRLLFLSKTRDYLSGDPRMITIFADEFKVHISRPAVMSLGASLSWRLHMILAFQSLQDLNDCPADLDKDAVSGSVMENCAIQLSYAIKDPDTREWLARSTGTVLVDDESRRLDKNLALAEKMASERTIRQSERFLIDENMFGALPVPDNQKGTCGAGVLNVAGNLAQFCYTSRIPCERSQEAITPTFATADLPAARGSVADELLALPEPPQPSPQPIVEPAEPKQKAPTKSANDLLDFDFGD